MMEQIRADIRDFKQKEMLDKVRTSEPVTILNYVVT